jgi:hypothetical protein
VRWSPDLLTRSVRLSDFSLPQWAIPTTSGSVIVCDLQELATNIRLLDDFEFSPAHFGTEVVHDRHCSRDKRTRLFEGRWQHGLRV